jgi:cytochrome c
MRSSNSVRSLIMRYGVLAIVLALTACGQPSTPVAKAPPPSTVPTSADAPTTETITTRLAALPAPYSEGDYENGRRLFAQCRACHTIAAGAPNRVGPHLDGVMGRAAGSVTDFRNYSPALKASGIVWDAQTMDRWAADPRAVVPATNMIYPGLRKAEDRRDLVAYIAVDSAE